MKYSFVISALLGLVSINNIEQVQALERYAVRRQMPVRLVQSESESSASESSESESSDSEDDEPRQPNHVQTRKMPSSKTMPSHIQSKQKSMKKLQKIEASASESDSASASDDDGASSDDDTTSGAVATSADETEEAALDADANEDAAEEDTVDLHQRRRRNQFHQAYPRHYNFAQRRYYNMAQARDVAPGSVDGVATKWGKNKPHPGYEVYHDDFAGSEGLGKYSREVPENFQGPDSGDDQFMNSMITKYALEAAKPTGEPTGDFIFKYANAKLAAYEIVGTHLGLTGQAADDYLNQNFDKTWEHFDTASDGKIEAARMSGFFRFLCGNMQINLH